MTTCHRKRAAALISAVAILLIAATFAALLLSVHTAQLSTGTQLVQRTRADAAARGGLQLALWRLHHDSDLQNCLAKALDANDTSYAASPLIQVNGTLPGAAFHTDIWPGPTKVRIRATATAGDAAGECWAQVPLSMQADNLLVNGNFEGANGINTTNQWQGAANLGQWCAGNGVTRVDDPRTMPGENSWNITAQSGNHFADHCVKEKNTIGQIVASAGRTGTLTLSFDYLRSSGNMSVTVRGMDTLPAATTLTPGGAGLATWSGSGTQLYDSGSLGNAGSWTHSTASINDTHAYAYYGVFIIISSNNNVGGIELAVDNFVLDGP
jgi:hypothetical protein